MKLKVLAAAAAVLYGANALAAINTIDDKAEVWAMVWNDAIGTYALDLGVSKGDLFSGTASGKLGAAVSGTAWTSFTAALKSEPASWSLFAIDTSGDIFEQGSLNILFSTPGTKAPVLAESDVEATISSLKNLTGNFGLNVNPLIQGDAYNAVGSSGHFTESDSLQGSWKVANAIGAKSNIFNCTDSGGFGNGPAFCSASLTQVTFDGTSFTAAVVPEPSTYALLLAGLLAVGFIARRRRD